MTTTEPANTAVEAQRGSRTLLVGRKTTLTTTNTGTKRDTSWIYAELTIRPPKAQLSRRTHELGVAVPEISVMFFVVSRFYPQGTPSNEFTDRSIEACGQCADDLEQVNVFTPLGHRVWRLWQHAHLNGMSAACEHMDLTIPEGTELPERYGKPDEQGWLMENVKCPETGKSYGSAWWFLDPAELATWVIEAQQLLIEPEHIDALVRKAPKSGDTE